ncbi:MAG: hypothetical protein ACUVWN_17860 [bacterium]
MLFTFKAFMLINIMLFILSCKVINNHREDDVPTKSIEEVIEKYTDELMSISGVVGIGQGIKDNKPCVMVLIIKDTPELKKKIPKTLDGYPVVIEVVGEIRALSPK